MSDHLSQVHYFESADASALCGYCILYYDYFLTLSREVDRFWHLGPHSWASIVFFANRYIALLGHIPLLYGVIANPCKTVDIQLFLTKYHGILMLLLHFLTAVLLMMRVYALYFRNKWVLAIVALEAVATISIGCWVLSRPLGDISTIQTLQKSTRFQTGAAFTGLLVFDCTVFALSTYRSINLGGQNVPFLNRLLVDGFMYYGVTWSVNLVNVVVLMTAPPSINLSTPVFANVLSVIMVSRLMINLYDPTLHESTVRGSMDRTDTNSRIGYISTFVPDGILFAPSTQADLSLELVSLDLRQDNATGSIPHCNS
ncbi:hypothetical protein EI94DRAFT_1172575 [Lactarius quietus]|nr:hypothetical protein EI94DRAFT_1172575 [Lactarius quietus]